MLLKSCQNLIETFFDQKNENTLNAHELVCTNDCVTNLKYSYEFITNFDLDEFIFPRFHNTTDYSSNEFDCKRKAMKNYNIYEYASNLLNLYGSNVSAFHFEHVLFLDHMDEHFLQKIFSYQTTNRTKFRKETFAYKNLASMNIVIQNKDMSLIQFIRDKKDLIDCLNRTIHGEGKLETFWNRVYGIHMNNRLGKSIFISNRTELVNQHIPIRANVIRRHLNVPLSLGFSSHFREDISGFMLTFDQIPFQLFYFDMEFYEFLANF